MYTEESERDLLKQNRPDDTFLQFWANYPRKDARKEALKAWIALDPDPELVATILAALQWQREVWTDRRFCPYPATYIRGERWTDEKPKTKSVIDQLPEWQRRAMFLDRKIQ